jgi:NitT/TauT family transport system substrate-binding protein
MRLLSPTASSRGAIAYVGAYYSRRAHAPTGTGSLSLARGEFDLCFSFASEAIMGLEAHQPITILGGAHIGCFELFGHERIRTITDLKNRTVGVHGEGMHKGLMTMIVSYIGLDPATDIRWVNDPAPMELFAAGKVDAFVALPPEYWNYVLGISSM